MKTVQKQMRQLLPEVVIRLSPIRSGADLGSIDSSIWYVFVSYPKITFLFMPLRRRQQSFTQRPPKGLPAVNNIQLFRA